MLESLVALFAVGTWAFFGLLAAFVIALIVFSEEDGVKATVTLVLGAVFLQFVAKFNLLELIRDQPFTLLLYVALYVVLGLVWSVVKWTFYVKAQRRTYDRIRREFCRSNGLSADAEFSLALKERWTEYLGSHYCPNKKGSFRHFSGSDSTAVIPDVTENKAAIIRWMTYWPFSMLFTVLNDPVRRLFEWIYESVGVWLQNIANMAFRGTEKDIFTRDDVEALRKQREEEEDARRKRQREDREFDRR